MAPEVAALLAEELGRNAEWCDMQVKEFNQVAKNYLPAS